MPKKRVVTINRAFADLDSLASAVTYAELLQKQGFDAEAVIPGPLNNSVTDEIQTWDFKYKTHPTDPQNSEFILVDISDSEYFPDFVTEKNIIQIIDHHGGDTEYWEQKLGKNCQIENVGACATQIWEKYNSSGHIYAAATQANLLYTAIVSNTLNFRSNIADKRDVSAFRDLIKLTDLPKNWIEKYFDDQQKHALANPLDTIINDTKIIPIKGQKFVIGQLELWDAQEFILKEEDTLIQALLSFNNPKWFLTAPSISHNKNIFITQNENIKDLLTSVFKVCFKGNKAETKYLLERKEVVEAIRKHS